VQNDPDEMKHVYGDPAYTEVQTNLHIKLEDIRIKYGDSDELAEKFIENHKR
jgi:hypothetical protein